MWNKLKELEKKYALLQEEISQPQVIQDIEQYKNLSKQLADLEEIVTLFKEYQNLTKNEDDLKELLTEEVEEDMRLLIKNELEVIANKKESLSKSMKKLLLPEDPINKRNIIMEIRAGAGGEEASLFAGDLFRMYVKYAEKKHWKSEVLSSHTAGHGGFKEIIFSIQGKNVYTHLKYESGVHRVQRVPITEASGRIHTSTATVAVLPEVEEVEVNINPADLKIDTFRASGAGGQHVNKTDSAVRITHLPTGIVVSCQDQRSQHQNKEKAMRILRAHLFEKYKQAQQEEIDQARKNQVGSGERCEKIRTYNYPQGRVSDHRINLTLYKLQDIMEGNLDELIEALIQNEQEERLKSLV